ncbi:MAG TPA: lauroyl acyltransferase [Xanthomonadaceae bacterium]|jgi:KDO2-lipid IV(A) lauroyltransferase
MRLSDVAGSVLYLLAALIGRLPMRVLHALGSVTAVLARVLDVREARVARRNLEIVYPQLDPEARALRLRDVLRATFRGLFETLRFWTRRERDNLRFAAAVHGQDLFDAALASGKGLIIAAPHYGNWELLNQWLAARTPITVLYRPPEHPFGEAFLRRVRGRANVRQVPAEGTAMRQLFRTLASGGVVGILPDQQPKAGEGLWAPFFGTQALSMTLLPRLAARTGATVLFAIAERCETGAASGLRFEVHLIAAPDAVSGDDLPAAVAAMNAAVEAIARRDPAQYQWTYKRYSKRPPGSGEISPYKPVPQR